MGGLLRIGEAARVGSKTPALAVYFVLLRTLNKTHVRGQKFLSFHEQKLRAGKVVSGPASLFTQTQFAMCDFS